MQIKRLDATPFLRENEKVEIKTTLKKGKLTLVEKIVCLCLWLVTLVADCFLVGVMYRLKDYIKEQPIELYIPVFVIGTIIHLVPFVFWLINVMKKAQNKENKWCCLTNERLVVVSETKPQSVISLEFKDITSYQLLKHGIMFFMGEERYNLNGIEDLEAFSEKVKIHVIDEENNSSSEEKTEEKTEENKEENL